MRFLCLSLVFFTFHIAAEDNDCIKSFTVIPMNVDFEASYLRVHPSGNYLLYTDGELDDSCSILELKKSKNSYTIKKYLTPLKEESYPVEPHWELISSPYHDDGTMKYYSFKDLITKPSNQIKEIFSTYFNEFYHSIGGTNYNFSMVRWNFLGSKDYHIKRNAGQISLTESATYLTCHNLLEIPDELKDFKDFLNDGMIKIMGILNSKDFDYISDAAENQITKEYKNSNRKTGTDIFWEDVREVDKKLEVELIKEKIKEGLISQSDYDNWVKLGSIFDAYEKSKTKKQQKDDVGYFDRLIDYMLIKPILSKDGQYISGAYKGETRVYKVNKDKSCTEIASLGAEVSKSSFAYPETFKNPVITFYTENPEMDDTMLVYVFDPMTKITHFIDTTKADSNVGFPGFTIDGRLIYIDNNTIKIVSLHRNTDGTLKKQCSFEVK